ncbi:shikimate dehydrogenase [Bradyrhizobium oligotrophicum S58]|uniref:Shikimate dehydrogenase (NADP(+)) n=1 Tax=Bradyrhizobium oligotrophicum S58 TaxID=1245469 RepID=M4ZBX3_9BRAD|nr:shikimate dehydrogenase [Bradyrhizobium oligotrophicum]BAM91232.1 shikimate dehydrogenase [Bradyrhizobium oligotrophicum S58]
MSHANGFGLAGVIGMPVTHSRSPAIHNFWLNAHNLRGTYVPLAVQPERLKDALVGLVALGFRGCNVTMPHKQTAMALLDRVNDTARRIGAVNTIVVEADGTLSGFNNDGNGFVQSLRDARPDWRADKGPILLLGAGGAARAVVVALLENGARDIRISNRTAEKAQAIATEFGSAISTVAWDDRSAAVADAALLINSTDRGMIGKPSLEIDLGRLSARTLVADLIYTPLETPFLADARARGCTTVNGLGLLLNQARLAFKAWFGVLPDVTPELIKAIQATF